MGQSDSWWLKTDRAKKHLEEIESYARNYAKSSPYEIVGPGRPKEQRGVWIYRLRVTEQPDPMLGVIVGEFLYDLRSALDHVVVALVPRSRRYKASFPVEARNIWQKDSDGRYVVADDEARSRFDSAIEGAIPEARAIIEELQPYHHRVAGRVSSLGLLSSLQNADKHRELIVMSPGVETTAVILSAPDGVASIPSLGFHEDGTEIVRFTPEPEWRKAEVNVQVNGMATITIKVAEAPEYAGIGIEDLGTLLKFVRIEVLFRLTLLVHRS